MIGPVIPGLNEQDIPEILRRAKRAGATGAAYTLLRLNDNVQPVFLERMAEAFPDRIKKIANRLKETRGGTLEEKRFFARHRGRGSTWHTIEQLFDLAFRKEGFDRFERDDAVPATFTRPATGSTQPVLRNHDPSTFFSWHEAVSLFTIRDEII